LKEKNVDERMRKDYCIGWFKVSYDECSSCVGIGAAAIAKHANNQDGDRHHTMK
jgi:hypothetical protein